MTREEGIGKSEEGRVKREKGREVEIVDKGEGKRV